MADAYQCLDSLRHMLHVRRTELMEKMAGGLEKEENYREHVGRCKELANTIDRIKAQIRDINGGIDDEIDTGK
jgi:hypothetical protein